MRQNGHGPGQAPAVGVATAAGQFGAAPFGRIEQGQRVSLLPGEGAQLGSRLDRAFHREGIVRCDSFAGVGNRWLFAVRWRIDSRHAVHLRILQPEMDIGLERPGDLAGDELAQRLARHAVDQSPDEVAETARMVGAARARLPPGRLRRQPGGGGLDVQGLGQAEGRFPGGQSGGMADQVADLDLVLAGLGKLRPVPGHRRKQVELATLMQHQHGQAGHRLGTGEHVDDGVGRPGMGVLLVAPAAPEVDHLLAVDGDAEAGAHLPARLELGRQRVVDTFEPRVAGTVQFAHTVLLRLS